MQIPITHIWAEEDWRTGHDYIWLYADTAQLQVGDRITFSGLTTAPTLNGQIRTISSGEQVDEFVDAWLDDDSGDPVIALYAEGETAPPSDDPLEETGFVKVLSEENDMLPVSVQNKIQTVFPPRAAQYMPSAISGAHNLNRVFKGLGALQAYSVPLGTAVTAILLPPVGPRSRGNTLRAQITMSGTHDIVVFEL